MECAGCETELDRTDRFCPGCGRPNPHTAFHPRFDPTWYARNTYVEPDPEPAPLPKGSPQCPRCERLMEEGDSWCRGCGMQLDEAWARHRLGPDEPLPSRPGRHGLHWYRPVSAYTNTLLAVLTVGVLLCTATVLLSWWLHAQRSGALLDFLDTETLTKYVQVATRLMAVMLLLGWILLVLWMHRMARNLPSLAVVGERYATTTWAVLGWFVPLLNLYRPKQVLDELWRATAPDAPPRSPTWRGQAAPGLTGVWWALLLTGLLIGGLAVAFNPGFDSARTADVQAVLVLVIVASATLGGAALVLQAFVRRCTGRMELRADRLGRLALGPVDGDPDADGDSDEGAAPVFLRAVGDDGPAGRY